MRFCVFFTIRLAYSRVDKNREWFLQSPEPHPRNDMQRRLVESRKLKKVYLEYVKLFQVWDHPFQLLGRVQTFVLFLIQGVSGLLVLFILTCLDEM